MMTACVRINSQRMAYVIGWHRSAYFFDVRPHESNASIWPFLDIAELVTIDNICAYNPAGRRLDHGLPSVYLNAYFLQFTGTMLNWDPPGNPYTGVSWAALVHAEDFVLRSLVCTSMHLKSMDCE